VDLSGQWSFQLDPQDEGIHEQWYNHALADSIFLPGSLQMQGNGEDVSPDSTWTGQIVDTSYFTEDRYKPYRQPGNIKVPFWLQPEKIYIGPAWYQRAVEIHSDWESQRVRLGLERTHWETRLWVDGQETGWYDSLSTPHVYDLGTGLRPGKHILTLRVDNRLAVQSDEIYGL
jgi:beta-galactosidase/beta-glucuronidase